MKTKNYRLLVALLVFLSLNVFAQVPSWQWAKAAGGSYNDVGQSVCVDGSGNVIMTGSFSSFTITFGSITLTNSHFNIPGDKDIFIVKYDPSGNVIWAKSAGGSSNDAAYSIASDVNGNVYISGSFDSPTLAFGGITLNNAGLWDIFIAKYDSLGNILWAKSHGGLQSDGENGPFISVDGNGNLTMTGMFKSASIIFDTIILIKDPTNSYTGDMFIAKYDSFGNILWAKSAGGNSYDYTSGITIDASDNIYVAGAFSSDTLFIDTLALIRSSNSATKDIFIIKYDPVGNILWAKSLGGIGDKDVSDVASDNNGNLIITGQFAGSSLNFGSTLLTNTSSFNFDIYTVKYDSLGNLLWAKSGGGSAGDFSTSTSTDASGNVFVTGWFLGPTATFESNTITSANIYSNANHLFVLKYSPLGNLLWAQCLTGSQDNSWGFDLCNDGTGNLLVTGQFSNSSLIIGNTTLNNNSNSPYADAYVAKLSTITGIEQNQNSENFTIVPNSFKTQTTISFSEFQKNSTLKITDLLGNEIKKINFSGKNLLLDRGEMKTGIYFIQLINENKISKSKKLIVE